MLPPCAEHMGIAMTKQVGSQSWRDNRLTSRLELQYPIIQGPLGGLSLPHVFRTMGGLGSFGAHDLHPDAASLVIN